MTTPETKTCGSCKYWNNPRSNWWEPDVTIGDCGAPVPVSVIASGYDSIERQDMRITFGADCPAYQPKEATDATV